MFDFLAPYVKQFILDIQEIDSSAVIAFFLISSMLIVLDAISSVAKKKRVKTGFKDQKFKQSILNTDNNILKAHHYSSDMQLLSGTPDALISENGFIIPIERKTYGKKIHDRYVVQLLVYMRLVEEFEGKKPPYGYLILGKNCRQIKIHNTPEKQAWLQEYIDAMQAILKGEKELVPTPQKEKCKNCHVKAYCKKASLTGEFVINDTQTEDDTDLAFENTENSTDNSQNLN